MKSKTCLWTALALALLGCNDELIRLNGTAAKLEGKPAYAVLLAQYGSAAGVALLDADGKLLSKVRRHGCRGAGPECGAQSRHRAAHRRVPTIGCWSWRVGATTTCSRSSRSTGPSSARLRRRTPTRTTPMRRIRRIYLCFDGNRGLLSRAQANPAPEAKALNRGDDLVVVDFDAQKDHAACGYFLPIAPREAFRTWMATRWRSRRTPARGASCLSASTRSLGCRITATMLACKCPSMTRAWS